MFWGRQIKNFPTKKSYTTLTLKKIIFHAEIALNKKNIFHIEIPLKKIIFHVEIESYEQKIEVESYEQKISLTFLESVQARSSQRGDDYHSESRFLVWISHPGQSSFLCFP